MKALQRMSAAAIALRYFPDETPIYDRRCYLNNASRRGKIALA
jgi:hypothetical protein